MTAVFSKTPRRSPWLYIKVSKNKETKAGFARNPIKKEENFLTGLTGLRDGIKKKHFCFGRKPKQKVFTRPWRWPMQSVASGLSRHGVMKFLPREAFYCFTGAEGQRS